MITFEDALKLARRNTYIYKSNWRVAIICPDNAVLEHAWEMTRILMEASSLSVEEASIPRRVITLQHGSKIRFCSVTGPLDAYMMGGTAWTQIMLVNYDKPLTDAAYLQSLLRSPVVDTDKFLWQPNVML